MSETFKPRLDILPESQRRLWPELDAVPSEFVLYGGNCHRPTTGPPRFGGLRFFLVLRIRSSPPALRAALLPGSGCVQSRSLGALQARQSGSIRGPRWFGESRVLWWTGYPESCGGPAACEWIAGTGRVTSGSGWHEDAGDSSSRELEGLRGYPYSGDTRNRRADGSGSGKGYRSELRNDDECPGAPVLRRWNAEPRPGRHAKRFVPLEVDLSELRTLHPRRGLDPGGLER